MGEWANEESFSDYSVFYGLPYLREEDLNLSPAMSICTFTNLFRQIEFAISRIDLVFCKMSFTPGAYSIKLFPSQLTAKWNLQSKFGIKYEFVTFRVKVFKKQAPGWSLRPCFLVLGFWPAVKDTI